MVHIRNNEVCIVQFNWLPVVFHISEAGSRCERAPANRCFASASLFPSGGEERRCQSRTTPQGQTARLAGLSSEIGGTLVPLRVTVRIHQHPPPHARKKKTRWRSVFKLHTLRAKERPRLKSSTDWFPCLNDSEQKLLERLVSIIQTVSIGWTTSILRPSAVLDQPA